MKHWLIAAIILCAASWQADAAVVSPMVRTLQSDLMQKSAERSASERGQLADPAIRAESGEEVSYLPLIIKLHNGGGTLPERVVELYRRGPFVLAYVPLDLIEEVEKSGEVSRLEGRSASVPVMNIARTFTSYPEVESCKDLPKLFTGRGVVTGFTDIGFDPNHVNFRNSADGLPRVGRLVNFPLDPTGIVRLDSPEEVSRWTTDDPDNWHATHVAGIMAGSYEANSYQGIATGAEIVATTSPLYDALLLAGMEEVAGYAREHDMPAVINMSISGGAGPHDGTTLINQYLDLLGEEVTICISAGNDGMRRGYVYGTFLDDCSTGIWMNEYPSLLPSVAKGYLDVWSADDTPLRTAAIVIDRNSDQIVWRREFPVPTAQNPETFFTFATDVSYVNPEVLARGQGEIDRDFAKYLQGSISVSTEISPENGRFDALFAVNTTRAATVPDVDQHRYGIGVEIIGKQGDSFAAYASDYLYLHQVDALALFTNCTTNGTINDFVTGGGVLSVGAMCSRNSWPLLSGEVKEGEGDVGKYALFSSFWSDSPRGKLPDAVAPGQSLVSSISTPYLLEHPDDIPSMTAMAESAVNGDSGATMRPNYWSAEQGTSMSSPYLAGVCALMLEANPDLTPAQVRDIVISNVATPAIEPGAIRWGRGILDSYACIRRALELATVREVSQDRTAAINLERIAPGVVRITADSPVSAAVYAPDGRMLRPVKSTAGTSLAGQIPAGAADIYTFDVDLSGITLPVVLLRATAADGSRAFTLRP